MSQKQPLKVGATPGKLALIGILAVVMVIVIASNWPSAAAPLADETALAAEPSAPTPAAASEVCRKHRRPVPSASSLKTNTGRSCR